MNTPSDTRTAYLYARILLGVSVFLSLACNAAHAYLNTRTAPLWLTLGVGAIPPLILALSVEATVFCSRHARWAWGWAAVTAAAGAGLVTGFSMSFAAISDLGRMAGMTQWTAPMLPVGIDALVITGLGMVALFRPRVVDTEIDAPSSVVQTPVIQPVTAPEPAPVTEVIQQPAARRDSHELPTVPPLMPVTHAPVIQHPEPATAPVNQPNREAVQETVIQVASWDDADTEPVVIQSAPAMNHAPEPVVNQTAEPEPVAIQDPVIQFEPEPVIQAETPANQPAEAEAVHTSEPAVNRVDQPAVNQAEADEVDHRAKAEAVAANRDWPVETLEKISHNTPGPSNRELAKDLGLSAASVQRMRKALEAAEETVPVA
ncbi:hypothetical protein [Mycobacteroides abscessus]|uniref:hypothetical protein n=1 Tax=Mycobacteroides abscessus TaxID=36809 RepID=UPI00266FAB90|nr:hypothetical protein [Mycobacteroides abscessus]MDO3110489.1 hypothetical protein [Mycobacteroides abscessus subsp. abscessus]